MDGDFSLWHTESKVIFSLPLPQNTVYCLPLYVSDAKKKKYAPSHIALSGCILMQRQTVKQKLFRADSAFCWPLSTYISPEALHLLHNVHRWQWENNINLSYTSRNIVYKWTYFTNVSTKYCLMDSPLLSNPCLQPLIENINIYIQYILKNIQKEQHGLGQTGLLVYEG